MCDCKGLQFEMMETSFFIARQTIISVPGQGMMPWREHLYVAMQRNAHRRGRLLPDPDQPGDRTGDPDRDLIPAKAIHQLADRCAGGLLCGGTVGPPDSSVNRLYACRERRG
jgi:hypothetical protein